MSQHPREGLGRNRRGPDTRGTTGLMLLGMALMLAGAGVGYHYLTQPQRVYGVKHLHCSMTKVQWTLGSDGITTIKGCGRTIRAVCDEERCSPPQE